jgi:hypothetical protein
VCGVFRARGLVAAGAAAKQAVVDGHRKEGKKKVPLYRDRTTIFAHSNDVHNFGSLKLPSYVGVGVVVATLPFVISLAEKKRPILLHDSKGRFSSCFFFRCRCL